MSTLGLLVGLQQVIGVHRRGVAMALDAVDGLVPARWLDERPADLDPVTHVSRNFFSLLLLTAYRALAMDDRQLAYLAGVNHAIRAVVTAADNLIDDEDKPVLSLALPDGAVRFRNSLGLLAWGMAFERIVGRPEGGMPADRVSEAVAAVMSLMVEIGSIEAEEEAGVDEIVPPRVVVERVHELKGGALLGLAFVVPRLMLAGDERGPRLDTMARGIHEVGLALQHVDDVTDLEIDVARRGHNLLQSEIVHNGGDPERAFLAMLRGGGDGSAYRGACAASAGRVVARALDTAEHGFGLMEQAGYPLRTDEARALIRTLFRVRGEAGLLDLAARHG